MLSAKKQLSTETFSRFGTDMSAPHLVMHLDRGCWHWDLETFLFSSSCQIWGAIKRMPWLPFTHDQFIKPHDKCILIEKDRPPFHLVMQTKIVASTSRTVLSHSYRDGNGNVTLMICSATKNVLKFDYVYDVITN